MSTPLAPPLVIDDYYELRFYEMIPGRLRDFHRFMRDEVPPHFAKAGVPPPLASWEGFAGPMSPLYAYLQRWRNLDERLAAWTRFYADEDYVAKRVANFAGQQRLESAEIFILRPSPAWATLRDPAADGPIGGIHELRLQELLNDDPNLAHAALAETDLPFLRERGASLLGLFSLWYGTRMNRAAVLLAWPDLATRQAALAAHDADATIQQVRAAERRRHGRPLFGRCDVHLLRPLDYAPAQANLAPIPAAPAR